jgi:hypothetical protein
MKKLSNQEANQHMVARINSLSDQTPARWGKMNVTQMLQHCQVGLNVAFGDIKLKRGFFAILIGGIAKKMALGSVPFKKNLPTDKAFIIQLPGNFEEEKSGLIQLVREFATPDVKLTPNPHPLFGKLSKEEWDILMWKHLDHHLRQFGV